MQKLATFVLMLCLTLSGVFSYAIGVAEQVNKKGNDGTPEKISNDYSRLHTCPTMPNGGGVNRGRNELINASTNEAIGFTISMSPNPATTWAILDYTLPIDATIARLILTNMYGVTIASYDLPVGQTQKVLDLRFLADGIYFYTVHCGKHSQTGKLIIVK